MKPAVSRASNAEAFHGASWCLRLLESTATEAFHGAWETRKHNHLV